MRLKEQNAKVVLKSGQQLMPAELRKAVKEADFQVKEIRLTATGTLQKHKGDQGNGYTGFVLEMPQTEQVFRLYVNTSEEAGTKTNLKTQLEEAFEAGNKRITAEGLVKEEERFPIAIVIASFQIVEEGD